MVIHGGKLDITGAKCGAAIGPGTTTNNIDHHTTVAGPVTIYGGTVKATGGENGAGIGGSAAIGKFCHSDGGKVIIYGGTVEATGGRLAAGVGGGGSYVGFGLNESEFGGNGGEVIVYGGTLTATGGYKGAGIGSGNCGDNFTHSGVHSGSLTVNGGTVTANGGEFAAGIGGGKNVVGGEVTIYGGTVTAIGKNEGAGIGGGDQAAGGTTTIYGGTVTAIGGDSGAGIGGGQKSNGGNTYIYGGKVVAIAGEDCSCRNADKGSAIGAGGGRINKAENAGDLVISAELYVKAGDSETAIERVNACRWRNYVMIDVCQHIAQNGDAADIATTYTQNDDGTHTSECRYCGHSETKLHSFDANDVCTACGKKKNADDECTVTVYSVSSATSTTYNSGTTYKVLKGQPFSLSAPDAQDGLIFMGYLQDPTMVPSSWEMRDDDFQSLFDVGLGQRDITPTANTVFYATYRYNYVPTWTWADDYSSATVSITCEAINDTQTPEATVTSARTDATADADGSDDYTASASYERTPGVVYQFSDFQTLPIAFNLSLADNADNDKILEEYKGGKAVKVTLNGRTLYKDGSWNTICLPFDLNASEVTSQLNPSELKTLITTSFDSFSGTLTLNFADATTIEAGKPYLIKWTSNTEWTNPAFTNVTIKNVNTVVTTDDVKFAGNFSPISLEAGDKTVLYLGADNMLYYPSSAMTVNACRAVFVLNDLTAGDLASGARAFVLNFGDETNGMENGKWSVENEAGAWYTLDGRKLSGKPTQKGIYINNGMKKVISNH